MPSASSHKPAARSRSKYTRARVRRRDETRDDKDRERRARKNVNHRSPSKRRARHRRTTSTVVEKSIKDGPAPRGSVSLQLPKREDSRRRSKEREVRARGREKPCRTTAQHKEGGRDSKSPAAGRKQRIEIPERKRSAERQKSLKKSYTPQPLKPVVAGSVEMPPGTWIDPPDFTRWKYVRVEPSGSSSENHSPIFVPRPDAFAGLSSPEPKKSSPGPVRHPTESSPEPKRHPKQSSPEPAKDCADENSNASYRSKSSPYWRRSVPRPTTPPRRRSRSREVHVARVAQDSQSRQHRRQSSASHGAIVPVQDRQTRNRAHQPRRRQSHSIQRHQPQLLDWAPPPPWQQNNPWSWRHSIVPAQPMPPEDLTGAINIIYTYVGEDCDIVELARDLRNVAPTFIVLCCCDWTTAQQMQTELMKEPVGEPTRAGGEQRPRPGPDELQYSYVCVTGKELIIAGRASCVSEVYISDFTVTPDGRRVLVAGSQSYVPVQGIYDWTLAAFGQPSSCGSGDWDDVATAMVDHSVRVMAGEFGGTAFWAGQSGLEELLAATRRRIQANVCAIRLEPDENDDTHAESAGERGTTAFVVNGPIGSVANRNPYSAIMRHLGEGHSTMSDASSNWRSIQRVWEKPLQEEFAATRRIRVFIGSKSSTRSAGGHARRRVRPGPWNGRSRRQLPH